MLKPSHLCSLGLALLLGACQHLPDTTPRPAPVERPALTLDIAHINDHHANLDPLPGFALRIDGLATRTAERKQPRYDAVPLEALAHIDKLKKGLGCRHRECVCEGEVGAISGAQEGE